MKYEALPVKYLLPGWLTYVSIVLDSSEPDPHFLCLENSSRDAAQCTIGHLR
jgi:hypothetical protein